MSRNSKSFAFNILGFEIKISITRAKDEKSSGFVPSPLLVFKYAFLFLLLFAIPTILQVKEDKVPVYSTIASPFSSDIYNSPINQVKKIEKPKLERGEAIVFNGPRDKKRIALTFDADMTPQMKFDLENGFVSSYYDEGLIKTLNDTKTKATLFLSGMWIESYLDVAKDLARNPLFELANHSYSHPGFHGECFGLNNVLEVDKGNELNKTQTLIKDLTGQDNKLFRFPGGCYSQTDLDLVSKTGQTAIQWDVAGRDGFNIDASNIASNILDNAQNGSIIVLHMNGYPNEPATAMALPLIISSLRQEGYEFVTVSELINEAVVQDLNPLMLSTVILTGN